MRVCRDWDRIPDYHKECAWTEVDCELCGKPSRVHRGWPNPPRSHKECRAEVAPKEVACAQCGQCFTVSSGTQIACRKNGWELPRRCPECKHDALLIKGAIGALKGQFPFRLETTIEQRGFVFTDKVAIVRNARTGETVAEVRMDERGFILTERVALATAVKTGERISTTRDGREGMFFPKRTADTYDSQDRHRTHRTRMVQKGVLVSERVAETTGRDGKEAVTRTRTKGTFFPRRVYRTDRE